jgi:twitching motility protein PilT
MSLFRGKLITYDEALRQATNPDDFALQVSGISSTSDARWDDFDKKDAPPSGDGRATGTAATSRASAAPARPVAQLVKRF